MHECRWRTHPPPKKAWRKGPCHFMDPGESWESQGKKCQVLSPLRTINRSPWRHLTSVSAEVLMKRSPKGGVWIEKCKDAQDMSGLYVQLSSKTAVKRPCTQVTVGREASLCHGPGSVLHLPMVKTESSHKWFDLQLDSSCIVRCSCMSTSISSNQNECYQHGKYI